MYQTSTVYHIFTYTKQGHLHPKGHPRDQLVLNLEKIRDITSRAFTMSLIKRTECITWLKLECKPVLLHLELGLWVLGQRGKKEVTLTKWKYKPTNLVVDSKPNRTLSHCLKASSVFLLMRVPVEG